MTEPIENPTVAEPTASEPASARRGFNWWLIAVPGMVLVVVLSWVGWTIRYYLGQNRIGAQVTAMGGVAYLEDAGPSWLAPLAGAKAFYRVVRVDFSGARITDTDLALLREVPEVRGVILNRVPIGDAGLAYLKGLKHLDYLDLSGTYVTDAGLAYLRDLQKLESLGLNETQITDAGLIYLRNLPNLQVVEIDALKVTDSGVNELRKALPHTQILHRGV